MVDHHDRRAIVLTFAHHIPPLPQRALILREVCRQVQRNDHAPLGRQRRQVKHRRRRMLAVRHARPILQQPIPHPARVRPEQRINLHLHRRPQHRIQRVLFLRRNDRDRRIPRMQQCLKSLFVGHGPIIPAPRSLLIHRLILRLFREAREALLREIVLRFRPLEELHRQLRLAVNQVLLETIKLVRRPRLR